MKPLRALAAAILATFVVHPTLSLGCRPIAGHDYRVPTKEERHAQADLVFTGKAIRMKKVPDMEGVPGQHPYRFMFTMKVEKWMKGSGERTLDVFDTTGTDCDSLFGINHLAMDADPLSSSWWLYVRKHEGRYWVITADRLK